MFKQTVVSGFMALTLACAPALAQTDSSSAPAPGGAPSESMAPSAPMSASPMGSMSKRHANRALIASCRSEAIAHGLKGHERRQSVLSCVRAQRPDLAVRMICRHKGKKMGLNHQSLRAFVKKCKTGRAG
jgi:hypothetical protein